MDNVLKCKQLTLDPYGSILYVTTSRRKFKALYEQLKGIPVDDEAFESCAGYCAKHGAQYLVAVFSGGIDTLVHELTHVAMYEALRTNFHNDNSNDEALAYLMGNMAGRVIKQHPQILEQS